MNRKPFQFAHRIVAVLMLASISAFAFVWTHSLASEQVPANAQNLQSKTASKNNSTSDMPGEITLRAENRGFPLVNLRDGKKFEARFITPNDKEAQLQDASGEQLPAAASGGQPRTMTSTDLNADGAGDLIVALASGNGGQLAIYQGSMDALSATTPEAFEGMKEGRFPAPFLPEARLINLPVAPDFVGTGDFNRDGIKDIIAAGFHDNKAFLLLGTIKGGYKTTFVELPGRVTAMLADNIDPLDNAADVAFAVAGENVASLVVYRGSADAFADKPDVYPLPAEAVSLAIGQLDNFSPLDIIAAVGGRLAIIHGSYPDEKDASNAARVEILEQFSDIAAVRVGNFVWDRENRPEIALLGEDGAVRILERGKLDKRAFTEAEYKSRSLRNRELMNREEAVRGLNYQPRPDKVAKEKWIETDKIQMASPGNALSASSASFFTSARMTPLGTEDLLVVDSAAQQLRLLVANNDEARKTGESLALSASGEHAALTLDVEGGTPVAVLPMRLNVMNRPGIVMLNEGSGVPTLAPAAPANTFNVTKTADTYDGSCTAADCSLREALQAANANTDSDIINVPAGVYTINTALGGPDNDTAVDPAAQQSGDWDVFYDTTINGAGQATTILQAAAAQPGHDRVLDAIQEGVGIPDLTLSGLTLRNGRCRADIPCVDGGGLRYAVDNLSVLTISNSTIDNNRTEVNTANPANNGGGIYGGQSKFSFTNVTVTNNTAAFVSSGCTGTTQCGGEGGGIFAGIRFTSNPTAVTITNSTVTGNTANAVNGLGGRGGAYAGSPDSVTISGGNFSSNTAFTDGGALRLFTPTTISGTSTTISNNSARQNGGGIWSDPLANDNTPQTNTFTNLVMKGNTADSDGAIAANNNNRGDGGAIFHGRGTLNLNNPTIGGTGAGEGNTAYDGGGIARTYSQFTAAVFNASTLNINSGGSIVGNQAINNGGGIINDATKSAAAGNASVLNMTGASAVTLTNNKARNNGGGIAVVTAAGSSGPAAAANLNNMTLRSNQANSDGAGGGDGGGLHNDSGGVSGGGTTFTGSLTIGGSGTANTAVNGGGIRNNAGAVYLPASASITYNTATATGGGISNAGTLSGFDTTTQTPVALNSPNFSNNTATGNGGGVFNSGTLAALTSAAINSNSAANGGGIYTSNGILTVTNGTINLNSVTGSATGGGILYAGSGASTVTGATVNNNGGSGIYITANALDITNTTVTGNTNDGISKTGTGTGSELISGNTIFNNGALGIDLSDNGVTPNDAAGDADTGPNNLQNYPVINYVRRSDGVGNVTLNSTANRAFRINFFANSACDSSGFGEGEVSLGTQNVTTNASGTITFTTAALAFGTREQITATATDTVTGDTSEFSACRPVNTLPTIAAQSGVTRQQGSPVSNSQIATVADPDQALNTLAVTTRAVGSAAPGTGTATVNGVTVSNIAVSSAGVVTADIIATCGATDANFTLRVTDGAAEFNETTLAVTVTANTAPTVGTYANTTVNAGSSVTVSPSAAPTDNGSIASVTATASAGFTGTLATNTTTGAVTITNANPAGAYTITVTTTDNCGAATPKTFTLTVNAIPTITAQSGVTRQQGSPLSNSQIATVADADQAANTLTVTIRAVAAAAPGTGTATVNGVTVSNIAVSAAGSVTEDIIATCGATNAAFTLRVTDANGAFSEATLNVAVTNNTAPTAGTYANTTVSLGGSTTVTPSAAPADNGTFTATVASSAGFTGTLAVDQTTGAVTITNAAPAGSYSITVTFTDGCTLATSRTFTLTVNTPPTISAASGVTRQQANGSSNSQIATVNDPDQAKNTLIVTIRAVGGTAPGTGTATVNGVTVSNILVSAAGVVTADIVAAANATAASFTLRVTDNQGAFTETTLNIAVTPASYEADVFARPNGDTIIDADDIQQIRNFSIGLNLPYQSNEFQRADCAPRSSSGDGFVDADDIQQARRYSVATDPKQTAAGPLSPPMNLLKLQTAKSFVEAVTGFPDLNAPLATPAFRIDNQMSSAGQTVTVPIRVDTAGNEAGYTFSLSYNSTILTNPQVTIGTAGGDVFSNAMTAGQIGFSVTSFTGGTIAAGTNLLLVNVSFTVAANASAGTTAISFTDTPARRKASGTDPNTPIQQPTYANGTVTITGTTAATVTIGGRVTTTSGRGIPGIRLTLTDQNGRSRTATSTDFGYYRFEDVEVGATYILSASGKRFTFRQSVQLLNITEANDRIDFIAEMENRSKNP